MADSPGRNSVLGVGHGERLRRTRGEAAGEKLDTAPVDRLCGERGNRREAAQPSASRVEGGQERRHLMAARRGGASVVVRGRESRLHGEGRQQACSG